MRFLALQPLNKQHNSATDQRVFQDGKINEHLRRKVRPRRGEHADDIVVGYGHILRSEDDPADDYQEKCDSHLSAFFRGGQHGVRGYNLWLPSDA